MMIVVVGSGDGDLVGDGGFDDDNVYCGNDSDG